MNAQIFIEIYNHFYGSQMENLEQIKKDPFDGVELLEFVNFCIKK